MFFLGMLVMAFFVACLYLVYNYGKSKGKSSIQVTEAKKEKKSLTIEDEIKNLMGYGYDKALGKGSINE